MGCALPLFPMGSCVTDCHSLLAASSAAPAFPIQVLSLPALVAPTKVLIVPLSNKKELSPLVQEISEYRRAVICPA